jgi:uncharacterized membrane protein
MATEGTPPARGSAITPRRTWADDIVDGADAILPNHWLKILNLAVFVFVALPIASPLLAAAGYDSAASAIFAAYSLTCHQLPYRSWFIFGHQMAFCQRDLALYATILIAGLVYGATGRRRDSISLSTYALLTIPIAVDGFTQLFGLRESDGLLRTITGALFGWGSVWMIYPFIERSMDGMRA